jgi:hypothetical protein
MDVQAYLDKKFLSRASADEAMRVFLTLRRRIRKYERGTSSAHAVLNIVIGIENTFDRDFVFHILNTRYNVDERLIYISCLRNIYKIETPHYNREFSLQLERDIYAATKGDD